MRPARHGAHPRSRISIALPRLLASLALAAWLLIAFLGPGAAAALGATPSPAAGGDPRSPGEGPGLVGDPVFALVAVAGIALISVAATLVYLRITQPR